MAGENRRGSFRLARVCRKFVRRSYRLANLYYTAQFKRAHRKEKSILLVHQMGKVGSSTVTESLRLLSLDAYLFHTHHLHPDTCRFIEGVFERYYRVTGRAAVPDHMIASRYLRQRLDRGKLGGRWKIISLVRDPVARNVSALFQTFGTYFPEYGAEYLKDGAHVEEALDLLLNHFDFENALPLRWFDSEVKDVFGIDVYKAGFPRERGYQTYAGDNADLLVVRLEDLNRCGVAACSEFLNLPDFELVNANVSGQKAYNDAYQNFKRSIQLPVSYLDRMYSSKYANHFYSAQEIEKFRTQWSRPVHRPQLAHG